MNININNISITENNICRLSLPNNKSAEKIDLNKPLQIKPSLKDFFLEEIENIKKNQANIKIDGLFEQNLLNQQRATKNDTSLDYHLQIANMLLKDTLEAVPFSVNNWERNQDVIKNLFDQATKHGLIIDNDISEIVYEANDQLKQNRKLAHKEYLENLKKHLNENPKKHFNHFQLNKIYYEKTKASLIGNCGEMSAVALFKGMERGVWNTLLEKASIGNHTFIVIGRKPGSNRKDYKTWGSSAVIMDSWAEHSQVFQVSEIGIHLNNYIKLDCKTGKPELKPFDPETQKIKLQISNICTYEDLFHYMEKNLDLDANIFDLLSEMVYLLQSFQNAKCSQTKLAAAEDIYNLCQRDELKTLKKIIVIKSQFKHFIKLNPPSI